MPSMLVQNNVEEVVPTLYKCYTNVLCLLGLAAGLVLPTAYCRPRLQADTDLMSVKCWASVAGAGQYPCLSLSQYFILPYLHTGGIVRTRCLVNVGLASVTLAHIQRGAKHDTVTPYWANIGSASQTVGQH